MRGLNGQDNGVRQWQNYHNGIKQPVIEGERRTTLTQPAVGVVPDETSPACYRCRTEFSIFLPRVSEQSFVIRRDIGLSALLPLPVTVSIFVQHNCSRCGGAFCDSHAPIVESEVVSDS